ncbi:MAG: PspC domain-containing protein [Eubacteriaceae bacterium]|nr:PspC domain-containing protein [Eubacteriaceae bacterium]
MNRLYKDRQNKMLGGVCSGIADLTDTDVTVIRVFAAASGLVWSPLIAVYFFLMLVLPDKDETPGTAHLSLSDMLDSVKMKSSGSFAKKLIICVIAMAVLAVISEIFFNIDIKLSYIAIFSLIFTGLYFITTKDFHPDPPRYLFGGTLICIFALIWLASTAGFLYFPIAVLITTALNMWPALLAAVGLSLLLPNKRHIGILWSIVSAIAVIMTVLNALSVLFR